ncbi:AcrB/AcrD/AcrF family protein [Moritella viscosa]|uniref:AcrB/AcrD/AcrF family protein n=1 Tax=Moritella viscosa TaxID=80854 RepID=A0A090I940_9GAMM|nr:efflux RND transporter permease subunit [Moritella viscosa]CED58400.1 membrane protein, AcrB/AcrD/AcrF family [Moritella viscosa]SGY81775.1 AcrB/AcrD/AcrF family protein [Moritella viscosa]SHN96058.1 AcrB/AcrD/AcrF family protein [Moritella viscosa]SHN96064.1 AcrB/AcrD/AcrF family protein [Moritella viscosa]SHN96172.1 AcrB/AcrD/AcrF family protein [Moritella viscosa]
MIKAFTENNRLMALLIILLIVAGLGSLSTLPRTEDPRITNRIASVLTLLPGASAERVEALVTEKIEQKLRKLADINRITSTSRPGISIVQLKLHDTITDTVPVWSRVRDLLNDVTSELPSAAVAPRLEDDRGYAYTQLIAVKWQGNSAVDLTTLGRYGKELQNQLKVISGTDIVSLFGRGEEQILVEIDKHLAANLSLSTQAISSIILAADAKVSAGNIINDYNQMQIEVAGSFDSVDRIRQIPLLNDNKGAVVRLGDIAKISKNLQWPAQEIALVDGEYAVVVSTRMLPNLRIDKWSAEVDDKVAAFNQQLPHSLTTEVLFDQSQYTEDRLEGLVDNILIGFSIIAAVLLVTLGWRAALIVTLSLPLTVLFTLTVMNYYGLPIHQMSVTGLVVALGIMVDNAIVMADTIQKRRQQGLDMSVAVQGAIKHLWLPLLGSTLTTILAFMPIVLMPGPSGEFVSGIALSVIFALIGSYLVSHTIVAGLSGRFLAGNSPSKSVRTTTWYNNGIELPGLARTFRQSLVLVLARPKLCIGLVFILPLSGFILAKHLDEQFFPASDRDMFHIELFMPVQTSIVATEAMTRTISDLLAQQQGISKVRWFIGNNAPSFYYNLMPSKDGAQYYAQAMVTGDSFKRVNELVPSLQILLDDAIPEAQILVRKLEQGPPFRAPIELRLFGPNLDTLKTLGDEARRILISTDNVIHTRATIQPGLPKIWLKINEDVSQLAGLTLTDVAAQLQSTLHGTVNGSIIEATESIPVRVRIANEQRSSLSDLANISLSSPLSQASIPLVALTELALRPSRGAIPHWNGVRVNTVEGYLVAGVLPSTVLNEFSARLISENFVLPPGYRMEFGGESAKRNDAVGNLLASVGVIIMLLIIIVVLSFNSFRLGGVIVLSAIQSVGLGLLSIYVFNYPFGFTVIIGLLGLMGLAINAAIVILAELKSDPKAVAGDTDAIIKAITSCTRHITSTTITTVGGFLPLILAGGGFWPPFAIAIAGGTVLTTLLSFYFVPAIFVLMSRKRSFEVTAVAA